MRIIALSALRRFWERHPTAETPLRAWHALASRARWETPGDIKEAYRNASFTTLNRVVFNIKGNDYRLVVAVPYSLKHTRLDITQFPTPTRSSSWSMSWKAEV